MTKDLESLFKKSLRSVAASFPVSASLAQWWSEMEADEQMEAIEELQDKVNGLQNPILTSHPKAKEVLELIFRKIESSSEIEWEVNDELGKFLEVLSLWEKIGYLTAQNAIGNRWISIRLTHPVFIMAVFSAVKGDQAALRLRRFVWQTIRHEGKGVHGEPIAENQKVPLVYIASLFQIFEAEGKGSKSKIIGKTYFSPAPELC